MKLNIKIEKGTTETEMNQKGWATVKDYVTSNYGWDILKQFGMRKIYNLIDETNIDYVQYDRKRWIDDDSFGQLIESLKDKGYDIDQY